MKMRTLTLTLATALVAVGVGIAPLALAQSPMQVHETRVAVMKEMGANLRTINESQKDAANHAKIVAAATVIQNDAKKIPGAFPAGTDLASLPAGGKNHAKPEIWQDKAAFDAAAKNLENEAAAMVRIASGTDNAAVQDQFKKIGAACGACHTKFRSPIQ